MKVLWIALLMSPASAAAHEIETCPDGQIREVVRELLHREEVEYDTYQIPIRVSSGNELLTIPAQYKWIDNEQDFDASAMLTYDDQELIPASYKKVRVGTASGYTHYNILLKQDGTYLKIDYENAAPSQQDDFIDVVDVPKHYKARQTTIPMPPPIEVDGRFKVLVSPAMLRERLVPDVVKTQTIRRVKSRKPAILQEVLGPCKPRA